MELPGIRCFPSLYISVLLFLQRLLAISAIFRHTYVDITPTEGLSVPAYQRHILVCKASFRGEAPDIEWFKGPGRNRLESNSRFAIQTSYNDYDTVVTSRLMFKNGEPSDSGTYICEIVSSGVGYSEVPVIFWTDENAPEPSAAILTSDSTCETEACKEEMNDEIPQYTKTSRSEKPAPVLTPDPEMTITPGGKHTITCTMQGGFEGTMLWSKDNRYIGANGNFDTDGDLVADVAIVPQSDSLVILNAKANDAGTYNCRFRYSHGRQWKSLAGSVNVYAGVDLRSDSYILWQGNQSTPLRVNCKASGYPLPHVSWSYTSKKLDLRTGSLNNTISIYDTQINEVMTQSTMTIARMPGFFNITRFTCKGENRISSKSNTIMVVNVGTTLLPGSASSTSCNSRLLIIAIAMSELLRRIMR